MVARVMTFRFQSMRRFGLSLIVTLVTILNLPSALSQSCSPPAAGLVGWWKGEGNGNDFLGTNNGTLLNGATFGTGEVGQAFAFNGNQSVVRLTNLPNLQSQNLTIEAWVKRSSTNQASLIPGVAVLVGYGSQGYALGMTDDGSVSFSQVDVAGVLGGQKVTDTSFHHVAVTR